MDVQDHVATTPRDHKSISNLDSLPCTEAVPETLRRSSVVAFTTAVQLIPLKGEAAEEEEVELSTRDGLEHNDDSSRKKNRPALISLRFCKETVEQRLGLGFQSVNGELTFSTITPTSLLSGSPIRVGDRLTSLDDHPTVTHWTGSQVASYLRSKEGFISMVIETENGDSNLVEACVYKSTAEQKLGVSFRSIQGQLCIGSVFSGRLLGDMSVLKNGDYVESINSTPAQAFDRTEAKDLINGLVGWVSIRTKKENMTLLSMRDIMLSTQMSCRNFSQNLISAEEVEEFELGSLIPDDAWHFPRPRFISVSVYKPTANTRLGVTFANMTGNDLMIADIGHGSLLCNTPLKAGCILYSVNGIPTKGFTRMEAKHLVTGLSGEIRICAEDRTGEGSYAIAMVTKPTPRSPLGLRFQSVGGGTLSISHIKSDGLFADSILNDGDKVIAINMVGAEFLQIRDAVQITQRNPDSATILVRCDPFKSVVLSHQRISLPR